MDGETGEWQTYRQVAVRLGVSVEAARRRALRGKWARLAGNDGKARVRPPDDLSPPCAPDIRPDAVPDTSALVAALEGHVETLKADVERLEAQLAAAEARDAQHVAQLAAEQAKTEKAIEAFSALAERLDALAAERARPWWRRLAG
jgi:hypothetical protein